MALVLLAPTAGLLAQPATETDAESSRRSAARERARDIARWVSDLSHPSLARREAATRALIKAGETAARRVRALCDSPDTAISLRARRIFGAIRGVDPETWSKVDEIIKEVRAERSPIREATSALRALGASAERVALSLLRPHRGHDALGRLYADLRVRRAVGSIAAGGDMGGAEFNELVAEGHAMASALRGLIEDDSVSSAARVHALWIYSLVSGAERVQGLLAVVRDRDPLLRREAVLAAADTLRADDFDALAHALGTSPSIERDLLVGAAARSMKIEDLSKRLSGATTVAALAAVALGHKGGDAARDALLARTGSADAALRASVAGGLARFSDDKSVKALASLAVNDKSVQVRASALSALRNRDAKPARLAIAAALFDDDDGVRLEAIDMLIAADLDAAAPALVEVGLHDTSAAVSSRALAALAALPGAPRGGDSAQRWRGWLDGRADRYKDSLPWFKGSREARRIVEGVREYVKESFFYFDKKELVERENLDKNGIEGIKRAFADTTDAVKVDGLERAALSRILERSSVSDPSRLLAALGVVPFQSPPSDLVRLTNGAARGIVGSLGDRYSRLVLSNDAEGKVRPDWLPGLLDNNDRTNGFIVEKKDALYVIDFVLYDSPAYYAGLRRGDQLVRIGEKLTSELTPDEIRELLGKEGEFFVLREGWNRPYGFKLEPKPAADDRLVQKAVLPGKIGYVRLKMFDIGCSVKIEQALGELESQGIVGLILDLRNNPGGTVIDATEIVDKFLPEGKLITSMEDRDESTALDEVRATDDDSDREYPLVVLINSSSASASEMVSGSLQGNKRATIVGQTSFGKGIGQSGRQFPGFSSETALGTTRSAYVVYLTMMRYYVPEGKRSVHHVGVEPDVPVRERLLKGSAFDKVMRVREGPDLAGYVSELLEKHLDGAIELARFDARDPSRYPDIDSFLSKAKRRVSEREALGLVRAELRRRLLPEAKPELLSKLVYDLQDDRGLRAAIRELADQAELDLSSVEEYSILGL